MRRNVYEYEDVRNVHYNIAVPNITDEMFETLYAHETLYHDSTIMPRVATPVPSTSPWADDSQARQNEASAGLDEISTMREGLINLRQGPTTGGLPVSFRPLSESGGSLGGQAPGLSLQHESC